MLTATLEHNGQRYLVLGVDHGDLAKLARGHPIVIEADDSELGAKLIVVAGETDELVVAELERHHLMPGNFDPSGLQPSREQE